MPHVAVDIRAERAFHVAGETETYKLWRTRVCGTTKWSPTRLKFPHRTRGAVRVTLGVTFAAVHQQIFPGRKDTPTRKHIHRGLEVGSSTGYRIRLVVNMVGHPACLNTITDMFPQRLRVGLLPVRFVILHVL